MKPHCTQLVNNRQDIKIITNITPENCLNFITWAFIKKKPSYKEPYIITDCLNTSNKFKECKKQITLKYGCKMQENSKDEFLAGQMNGHEF